jgi:NAD(P)-dependent dehydrogenase (short-subunit alcohol dehydrogenase family)
LEDKVAVITGGGNGIGRACAVRFAEEGADIVVGDLLEGPGGETVAAVEAAGRKATFVQIDAASPADNERLMDEAVAQFGGIDVLVTAAGISHADYVSGDRQRDADMLNNAAAALMDPAKPFLDLTMDGWQKVLDVNLTGTFLAVQSAARRMVEAGRAGSIITIGSIASKVPEAGPLSYGVSKAGVWMLTKHVARSLGPAGIRVNAIGPGFIDTNMTKLIQEIPMVSDHLMTGIPLRRLGSPVEVANTALFLASDESSYFTGEILHPDGGFYTD